MKMSLKIALSLLISVIIFSVFFVIASSGLFKVVEATLFVPRIKDEYRLGLEKTVKELENYHKNMISRFEDMLTFDYIPSAFLTNQSQSKNDITLRDELFYKRMQLFPDLEMVRFVSEDGKFIHYSTQKTDLSVDRADLRSYFTYDQVEKNIKGTALVTPKGAEPKVVIDGFENRFIYSFPIVDRYDIYKGTALFYVSIRDLSKVLASIEDIPVKEPLALIDVSGVLIGIPSEKIGAVRGEILDSWTRNRGNEFSEVIGITVKDNPASGGYFLFSRRTPDFGIVAIVAPKSYFEIADVQKIIIYILFFVTVYLIVFIVFNLRQDPVSMLTERIKLLQISFIKQFIESKNELDWEKWHSELTGKRPEITGFIKKGIGRLNKKQNDEIDFLINRGWDEIISVVSKKAELENREQGVDMSRIEEIITRALAQGNIVIPARQIKDTSDKSSSSADEIKTSAHIAKVHDKDEKKPISRIEEPESSKDADTIEEVLEEITEEEALPATESGIDEPEEISAVDESEPIEIEEISAAGESVQGKSDELDVIEEVEILEAEELQTVSEPEFTESRGQEATLARKQSPVAEPENLQSETELPDSIEIEPLSMDLEADEELELIEVADELAPDINEDMGEKDVLFEESLDEIERLEKELNAEELEIEPEEEPEKELEIKAENSPGEYEDVELGLFDEKSDFTEFSRTKTEKEGSERSQGDDKEFFTAPDTLENQEIHADQSDVKNIVFSPETAGNLKKLFDRVDDEISKKEKKISAGFEKVAITTNGGDGGAGSGELDGKKEASAIVTRTPGEIPELEIVENTADYLDYKRGGKYFLLSKKSRFSLRTAGDETNEDAEEVESDPEESGGETAGPRVQSEGENLMKELADRTISAKVTPDTKNQTVASEKEIEAMLKTKKILVYSLSEMLAVSGSMNKSIIVEGGVYRIKKDLFHGKGTGVNSELKELVRSVSGQTRDSDDTNGDTVHRDTYRGEPPAAPVVSVRTKGIEYDTYMQSITKKTDDITIVKSLVSLSRSLESIYAGIITERDNIYGMEYSVGLQDQTKTLFAIPKSDPYVRFFFVQRRAFLISLPVEEIVSLRSYFSEYDRKFLNGLAFLPSVFKGKDAYLFLGFPKYEQRDLRIVFAGLGV